MSNELQTLNERISEKVGETLVDLIPAEKWQQIVDREIAKFENVDAPKIIQSMLEEKLKASVTAEIDRYTVGDEWNEAISMYVSSALKQFIGESSGVIMAGMLSPAMTMVMQDLRSRIGY